MRAVVVEEVGNRDTVSLQELASPVPGTGEVVVDVEAAGVNFPDLLVIDGKYQSIPPTPFSPGKEAAGRVSAVGDGAGDLRPGDRVMVQVEHGAFAEQVVAEAVRTFRMPEGMDFATGAAMGLVYQTAFLVLKQRANVETGDSVLVTGASGGVGLAAVQLAKAFGAKVLAGLTTPSKADAVLASGADHVVDLSESDLRDGLRRQVHALTDGKGVDVIIDLVGGDVFDAGLRALAWSGRIVVAGFTSGRIPSVAANYLLLKNIAAVGLTINGFFKYQPDEVRRVQQAIFELYEAGKINPVIMERLPLERFSDAMHVLESRKVVGKVVLAVR